MTLDSGGLFDVGTEQILGPGLLESRLSALTIITKGWLVGDSF